MNNLALQYIRSGVLLAFLGGLWFLCSSQLLFATTTEPFTPMVRIPGMELGNVTFEGYINALYILSISLAALLAVFKIIWAGVQWMFTDIVTSKQQALKDIQGSLVGLLIIMAAVLVLGVINPDLKRLDVFSDTAAVRVNIATPEPRDKPGDPLTDTIHITCENTQTTNAQGAVYRTEWNCEKALKECTDKSGNTQIFSGTPTRENRVVICTSRPLSIP